jgi:hypothetical protein
VAGDRKESFLDRWSRRKRAAARGDPLPEPRPVVEAPVIASPAASMPEALPSVESLQGLASEYKDFLQPGVDPATRSAALKRLFSDPHFNRMDGLDVYIDDYANLETLPAAAVRLLNQAQSLGLFEEEAPPKSAETEMPGLPGRISASEEQERVAQSPDRILPCEGKERVAQSLGQHSAEKHEGV